MAKFFQVVNMQAESVASMNRSGIYLVGATPTAVYGGAFAIPTGLATDTSVYGANYKDLNKLTFAYEATPSAGATVFVSDPVKVSDGTIAGNTYRIGAKTLGLQAGAGEVIRWREVRPVDQFILGADNFVSAPTVGQYAVRTNGSVDLTPSGSVGSAFAIAIDRQITVSEGIDATTTAYVCRVVRL